MSLFYYEEELALLLSALLTSVPSSLLGIVSYVLTSWAVYTIACRRGLRKPWLAWVPVANVWLLGSLSDQYQYVVRGRNTAKRKWLLSLSILKCALTTAIVVLGIGVIFTAFTGYYHHNSSMAAGLMGQAIALAGVCLPLTGTAIAYAVIYYMALYDVYKSLDPANCALFLVLSIPFGFLKPFFLFFNRDKEAGMPPRRQEPVYTQTEPTQEPDYL